MKHVSIRNCEYRKGKTSTADIQSKERDDNKPVFHRSLTPRPGVEQYDDHIEHSVAKRTVDASSFQTRKRAQYDLKY